MRLLRAKIWFHNRLNRILAHKFYIPFLSEPSLSNSGSLSAEVSLTFWSWSVAEIFKLNFGSESSYLSETTQPVVPLAMFYAADTSRFFLPKTHPHPPPHRPQLLGVSSQLTGGCNSCLRKCRALPLPPHRSHHPFKKKTKKQYTKNHVCVNAEH